jgi:hypothetical protein
MKFRCLERPHRTIIGVAQGRMLVAGFGLTGELDARQVAQQNAVSPEAVAYLVMAQPGYGETIVPADDEARSLILPASPPGQEGAGVSAAPAPTSRGRRKR